MSRRSRRHFLKAKQRGQFAKRIGDLTGSRLLCWAGQATARAGIKASTPSPTWASSSHASKDIVTNSIGETGILRWTLEVRTLARSLVAKRHRPVQRTQHSPSKGVLCLWRAMTGSRRNWWHCCRKPRPAFSTTSRARSASSSRGLRSLLEMVLWFSSAGCQATAQDTRYWSKGRRQFSDRRSAVQSRKEDRKHRVLAERQWHPHRAGIGRGRIAADARERVQRDCLVLLCVKWNGPSGPSCGVCASSVCCVLSRRRWQARLHHDEGDCE